MGYLAGCEWVTNKLFDSAREAFTHAASGAAVLMECLEQAGLAPRDEGPPDVLYNVHVATLFSGRSQPDEYFFLRKAVHLAEELNAERSLCQDLWSSVFEKAVALGEWDEAHDVLLRLDSFENHLRQLSQKLRSSGRIDLMLKL